MSAAASAAKYRELLAAQDWSTLHKKLKFFAWKATGSRSMDRAEDLAQDAVARLWEDAGVRWDPEMEPSLLRFLTGLVRGNLSNERRLKRTSNEVLTGADTLEAHGDGGKGAADELLSMREARRRGFAALRERTAGDAVGSTVAALFEDGIDGASEQADASGTSIEDIRRARRRVFDHAAAIGRESGEVA